MKNTVRAEVLINGFRACGLFPWNVNNIDFKKCLGKNPNTEITAVANNETDTGMLDYKQFSDIVGTETIDKFKDIKNVITNESLPEEFFVLYRLHEKLKNNEVLYIKLVMMLNNYFLIIACHHLMKSLALLPT